MPSKTGAPWPKAAEAGSRLVGLSCNKRGVNRPRAALPTPPTHAAGRAARRRGEGRGGGVHPRDGGTRQCPPYHPARRASRATGVPHQAGPPSRPTQVCPTRDDPPTHPTRQQHPPPWPPAAHDEACTHILYGMVERATAPTLLLPLPPPPTRTRAPGNNLFARARRPPHPTPPRNATTCPQPTTRRNPVCAALHMASDGALPPSASAGPWRPAPVCRRTGILRTVLAETPGYAAPPPPRTPNLRSCVGATPPATRRHQHS